MTKQLKKSELIADVAIRRGQPSAAVGYMLDGLEIAAKGVDIWAEQLERNAG